MKNPDIPDPFERAVARNLAMANVESRVLSAKSAGKLEGFLVGLFVGASLGSWIVWEWMSRSC